MYTLITVVLYLHGLGCCSLTSSSSWSDGMGIMSVSLEVLVTLSGWRFGDLIPDNLFSLGPLNIQLSKVI